MFQPSQIGGAGFRWPIHRFHAGNFRNFSSIHFFRYAQISDLIISHMGLSQLMGTLKLSWDGRSAVSNVSKKICHKNSRSILQWETHYILVLLAGGWRQVEVFQSNAVFFVSSSSSSTSSPSIHTGGIGFQHLHLVKGVLTLQHSVTTSLTSNNSPALAWVKRKCWSVMSH